jgi:DNA polymerase-3 subunit beta
VNVPKDELLSAVKRASLFARDNANVIKIQIDEGTVSVSAENSQIGSNVTKVESEVEGEKILMAFNAKYLIDYLSVVEGDFVEWETEGELKPSVLRDSKNQSWLQVIMPIRVQS